MSGVASTLVGMGKASRRARQAERRSVTEVSAAPAPFVARPFEGLPAETDLVAMREIVPSATAVLTLRKDAPALVAAAGERPIPETVTLVTLLPMGLPGLHRGDGTFLIGLQGGSTTGDASRDVAQVLLELLATEPGTPVRPTTLPTAETPRLQDLVDCDAPAQVEVHDTFDYWMAPGAELDGEAKASLQETNESIIPTVKLASVPSAYWCHIGERTFLRWMLPQSEDVAVDALARLLAAGEESVGEGTRVLGAFRACGLLAPVWDLDPAQDAASYEAGVAAMAERFEAALKQDAPLTAEERRARSGLLGRQLTLR